MKKIVRQDENIRSVRFSGQVDERLNKLALKLGRTKRMLVIQMIDYFYRSRKDPSDLNDEMLKKELSAGVSRILSFIRQQESDLLAPAYAETVKVLKALTGQRTAISEITEMQKKAHQKHSEYLQWLRGIAAVLNRMHEAQEDRKALKKKSRDILEYYIVQRESLGWTASQGKKDELAAHCRRSLDNL